MADTGKKVEVRFGSFSCSIEGYDDPVEQMREVLLLVQRMIRETPALAEYEPQLGDAEVAQIESALGRHEGEGGDGSPRVVVIRAGAADPRPEVEDAVTTAEMPPGWQDEREDTASALGETEAEAEIGTAAAGVAPVAPGQEEGAAGTAEPETALDDETGAGPTAAAMFAAPAAEVAGSAFTADDERREPAGADAQGAAHEEPAGTDAEPEASGSQPDSGASDQAGTTFEASDAERSRVESAAGDGEEVADPKARDGLEGVAGESLDEAEAGEPQPDALVDRREPDGEPKEMELSPAEDERSQADVAYHLWDAAADPGEATGTEAEDAAGAEHHASGEPWTEPGEAQDWSSHEAGTSPADDASFDPPVEESVSEPSPWTDEDASAETTPDEWRTDTGEGFAVEAAEHGSESEAAIGDEHRTGPDHDEPNGNGSGGDAPWTSGREVETQASEREETTEPERPRASGGDASGIFAALAAVNAAAARATTGERESREGAEASDDSALATANIFAPPPAFGTGTRFFRAEPGGGAAIVNIFASPAEAAPARARSALADARAQRDDGLDHLDDLAGELAAVLANEQSDRNIFAPPRGSRSGIGSEAPADVTSGPEEWDAAHSTSPARRLGEGRPGQDAWPGNSLVFAGPEDSTTDAEARRHDRESQSDEAPAPEGRIAAEDGALGTHAEEDAAGEDGRGDRHSSGDTAGPGLGRFSALLARLGGRGTPEPQAAPTEFPGRSGAAGPEGDPAGLAKKADAHSVPDLLAVAAAWLTLVEGKQRFTRREVMEIFENLPGDHPRTLEARIKGFGQLVRSGILVLVAEGFFAMAQAERDRFQALLDRD